MIKDVIPALLVFIFIVLSYFYVRKSSKFNKNVTTKEDVAILRKKSIKSWVTPKGITITEYIVEFSINGSELELKVPEKRDYDRLIIGERGILKYQMNRLFKLFVDFKITS